MPAEDTVTRPRQKDSLDELLANFEFARIKEYVDKRSREEAQAQMTVKPVGTVQHCSPCTPNPDMSSGVYFNLENNEDEMGPELEKLKSSSAGTGLNTPGQQCPPKEGIRETGRTTASGTLTAGASSSKKRNISTSTGTVAGISSTAATPGYRRLKTFNEENKQFDPGGQGEKTRLGTRLYSTFISGQSWEAPCCFLLCALCVPVFPRNNFLFSGDDFSERREGRRGQVADVRNRRASVFSPTTLSENGEDKQRPV